MSIVVGYIPTREGHAALRRAATECGTRGSDLLVVHTQAGGRSPDPEAVRAFDEELGQVRARLAAVGRTVEVWHEEGGKDFAEDLIGVADAHDAEMIVIGLRRRTPVGKLILGSSSQRILLDASCPVLAVKAGQGDT